MSFLKSLSKKYEVKAASIDKKLALAFIKAAHDQYNEQGSIEVDVTVTDPLDSISTSETLDKLVENGGLYVKAWVWVDIASLPKKMISKLK